MGAKESKKATIQSDLTAYQKRLSAFSKGLQGLYLDKVRGTITEAEYVEFGKDFHKEQNRLEALVRETEAQLEALEQQTEADESNRALIDRYIHMEHLDRETVDALIERIYISKRDA